MPQILLLKAEVEALNFLCYIKKFGSFFLIMVMAALAGCYQNSQTQAAATVKLLGTPGVAVEIFRFNGAAEKIVDPAALVPLGTIQTGRTYSFPAGGYYAVNACSALFFDVQGGQEKTIQMQTVEFTLLKSAPFRFLDVLNPVAAASSRDLWQMYRNTEPTPPQDGAAQISEDWQAATGSVKQADAAQNATAEANSQLNFKDLQGVIAADCVHPLTGARESYTNRTQFEILPGQVSLAAGGRLLIRTLLENKQQVHQVDLLPVVVKSAINNIQADFFATPLDDGRGLSLPVVSASVGSVLWLPVGKYVLEINGTKQEIDLRGAEGFAVSLGALELRIPKNFPLEERIKHGGQPPFAFINEGVLFTMDTPYLVFPGSYTLTLDQSDVRSVVTAYSGETTVVQTLGATIEMPECPNDARTPCKRPPGITIHSKQKPFVLMTVETGIPFLVLNEEYEFGVEGLRGILKKLNASNEGAPKESLARLNIDWQVVQAAPKVRTDLVRLESRGDKLYGKSLDFLFTEPKEVYVPAGQYDLSYLVGDPAAERTKVRKSLSLDPGSTTLVSVPIYSDRMSPKQDSSKTEQTGRNASGENINLPIRLEPVGK